MWKIGGDWVLMAENSRRHKGGMCRRIGVSVYRRVGTRGTVGLRSRATDVARLICEVRECIAPMIEFGRLTNPDLEPLRRFRRRPRRRFE
jgi:hypothetical protein